MKGEWERGGEVRRGSEEGKCKMRRKTKKTAERQEGHLTNKRRQVSGRGEKCKRRRRKCLKNVEIFTKINVQPLFSSVSMLIKVL